MIGSQSEDHLLITLDRTTLRCVLLLAAPAVITSQSEDNLLVSLDLVASLDETSAERKNLPIEAQLVHTFRPRLNWGGFGVSLQVFRVKTFYVLSYIWLSGASDPGLRRFKWLIEVREERNPALAPAGVIASVEAKASVVTATRAAAQATIIVVVHVILLRRNHIVLGSAARNLLSLGL